MTSEVLVVGGKPARERFRRILQGHKVGFVKSGAEALKAAHDSHRDLILMDVQMPAMSGYEVAGKLRASAETSDIPIVFYSSRMREPDDVEDYVVSLSDVETLKRRIELLLKEREGLKIFREIYGAAMAAPTTHQVQELTENESKELARGGFPIGAAIKSRPIVERAAEYAALVNSSLSTYQAAARLGVNASRVRQRLLERPPTLYGVRKNSEWVLPAFQFQDQGLVPGMEKVTTHLDPELDLVAVHRWFTRPNLDLVHENESLSPRDWLRQGLSSDPVAKLAEDL